MTPKRTSTFAALAMTQAAIRKLVVDSVAAALEAQAATMANANNTNRNIRTRCCWDLIRWFERTESVFSHSNCTEDCKVKFATGTLTEEALSWWKSFAQPIRIEEAYKILWSELKKLSPNRGPCTVKCQTCNKVGHLTRNCKNKEPAIGSNLQPVSITYHACEEKGNYKSQCSRANNNAHGRAYLLRDKNAHQDTNIVTGTFLLNQHLARVIFDSVADKSFVSISLASIFNISPITLDTTYDIEMTDGNLVDINTVIQGCTLILLNQPFEIDLMPIKLGSFDIVIGMDWLSKYHAIIICDEKVVHIPIDGETLIIRVFINDILIYSRNKEEHEDHLRIILELLKKEKLYAKFPKCDFLISIMQFLGHMIDSQGIHVDPAKIEAVKNWASPTTPTEIRQFLGLADYYQRFIKDFSKIAKSLTNLT
ncbi:reverse transcriptase domain-containing protein [Tanacetum coccineum]